MSILETYMYLFDHCWSNRFCTGYGCYATTVAGCTRKRSETDKSRWRWWWSLRLYLFIPRQAHISRFAHIYITTWLCYACWMSIGIIAVAMRPIWFQWKGFRLTIVVFIDTLLRWAERNEWVGCRAGWWNGDDLFWGGCGRAVFYLRCKRWFIIHGWWLLLTTQMLCCSYWWGWRSWCHETISIPRKKRMTKTIWHIPIKKQKEETIQSRVPTWCAGCKAKGVQCVRIWQRTSTKAAFFPSITPGDKWFLWINHNSKHCHMALMTTK